MVCGAGALWMRSAEEMSGEKGRGLGNDGKKRRRRGMRNGWQRWVISTNSTKREFSEHPLRCSMELVELGARSMFFADLEFLKLRRLARKIWSEAVF